ncbi:MAG TPA: GxxExxY protein [Planctomycetaceae bacterium]
MPVKLRIPIRRFSQQEFAELSFEVMRHVFSMHNEIGRLFGESIYKQELAHRVPGIRLEEPIEISFDSFRKTCFVDVLVGDGGIFEFKAVESLTGAHRAQLLQYLMLCDVTHGKLINIRTENVEHEFVNTSLTRADRMGFRIEDASWNLNLSATRQLQDFLVPLLRDLGTGLGIPLYEEAVEHCFGGEAQVRSEVGVRISGHSLGNQRFRLIGPDIAFKITGFDGRLGPFEAHARRLLGHVDLRAIAWVNISAKTVTFSTLEP